MGGDTTTLLHHPYILCHFANHAHHKSRYLHITLFLFTQLINSWLQLTTSRQSVCNMAMTHSWIVGSEYMPPVPPILMNKITILTINTTLQATMWAHTCCYREHKVFLWEWTIILHQGWSAMRWSVWQFKSPQMETPPMTNTKVSTHMSRHNKSKCKC